MKLLRLLFLSFAALAYIALAPSSAYAETPVTSPENTTAETPASQNDTIQSIRVEDNQRIEARSILTYLDIRQGQTFDNRVISEALKKLFATGFFSDVKLLRSENTLVVKVVENPVINTVNFEGNDRIESDDLNKEIELKSRAIYTKTKLQNDVRRILDIYRRSGRYTATVEPKIITLDQNRVDLIYEIDEGPVAKIEKITFIGNNSFSSTDLRRTIRSSEERWYQFLTDDDKYDPDRLLYDKELLRRYYVSQGYADFQVRSAHAELSPNKDEFYVTFVIDEGPRYHFSSVTVDSTLKGPKTPNLEKVITTKANKTFDGTAIESSIDAMTQELGNFGFAFVEITPRMKRDREAKTIDLTYVVRPGPRVYVERINIVGNQRTLDEVIRREFRLAEGDPFSNTKLKRSEQRLNNINYFNKVTVTNEPGSSPDRTIINVEVEEKSTGEINFGAGFSSVDGPLADFGISEHNLLGRGQDLRARVTYSGRRKQVEFGFTEPYFLNRELSAGFDVYRTSFDYLSESSYNLDSQGINLKMGYNIREKLIHQLNYSFRDNDITDIQAFASPYIFRQQGRHVNSSVGHALVYDDRNNRLDPTDGYYLRFYQEVAGVGGDSKYIKHEVKTSYYYPIAKNWTWSAGGAAGHLLSYGGEDIFISDRFFIGGEMIRGFNNSGIGPRDASTHDALGGNLYYAASTELKFPLGLPEDLGFLGAMFVDVGSLQDVDETGVNVFDGGSTRVSAGVGVAWASPFGPIRIDLAYPIVKEPLDVRETFRFSFGTRF